ncbi:MAG: hypothetical protein IJC65_04345 [Oscillospiraceae bacterium]|nr:hypothetical protein [Oscillospiraceae bacterium]
MNIDIQSPYIKFAQKGKPFNYEKLFLNTLSDYIFEYKNAPYESLTDRDKSTSLARIIRKMEVNGVPVQEFFAEDLAEWREKGDTFQTVLNLVDLMSKDIFGCFDPNMRTEAGFKRTDRLYAVNNDGTLDYIMYQDEEKKGLFAKKKEPTTAHKYFAELLDMCQRGLLPRKKK